MASPATSLLPKPGGFKGLTGLVVGAEVDDALLPYLHHIGPQMLMWNPAGRSAALNTDERHLALSSVEDALDLVREVLLAAQGLQVVLEAAEDGVPTHIRRGSRPAR